MSVDPFLADRLRLLERRVAIATSQMRANDHEADHAFRGLYITDEQIDRLLSRVADAAAMDGSVEPVPPSGTLRCLAERFDLVDLDVEILMVAVAPEVDRRFEQFYGYLHDDVTRRRASPGLAISLLGLSNVDASVRRRFARDMPLVGGRLLEVEDEDRPFLTRALRVPDRVVDHLLGSDRVDSDLAEVVAAATPRDVPFTSGLAEALERAKTAVYLRELGDRGAAGVAVAAFQVAGLLAPLTIDLCRADGAARLDLAELAVREARLEGRGLVVGPIDDIEPFVVRFLTENCSDLVLHGSNIWNGDSTRVPTLVLDVPDVSGHERTALWTDLLPEGHEAADAVLDAFRLGPSQIRRAVAAAEAYASVEGHAVDKVALAAGARTQNSAGLERLARRVAPSAGWDDIVLPADTMTQLGHVTARVAHRTQVLDNWGLRRGGGRGEGITALFAGDSGTGKTMAAEVIATALELDMYVIDLSTVVDKYVGETEKNLDRIFTEAEGVNGVLFFDEADALFGKRSEVSDARDRYANVEVAFLLQRMEQFDGLAVLASNLRGNLDDAFARRLSVVVDFPDPDEEMRLRLWSSMLSSVPLAADVDLPFLAQRFPLTGGNIRNVAVTAAYLSAADALEVGMHALVQGVQIEYRKLGRLILEDEFEPYHETLSLNGHGPGGVHADRAISAR